MSLVSLYISRRNFLAAMYTRIYLASLIFDLSVKLIVLFQKKKKIKKYLRKYNISIMLALELIFSDEFLVVFLRSMFSTRCFFFLINFQYELDTIWTKKKKRKFYWFTKIFYVCFVKIKRIIKKFVQIYEMFCILKEKWNISMNDITSWDTG